jgi:hypothetical protein
MQQIRERRILYKVLVVNPEGRRLLGRPRPRWEGNINTDLREVKEGGMD